MRGRLWLRRIGFGVMILAVTWVTVIASQSARFVKNLLEPYCPADLPYHPAWFEPVELTLADGTPLRGWWHPPENGAAVVLMGGHRYSRDGMLPEARFLEKQGYGALTLDYRDCAGQNSSLGAWETEEYHVALDFVKAQPGVEWIAALGFSEGGSVVIRGSVSRPEVRAVIAEGQYGDLWSEILLTPAARLFSLNWQVQHGVALILWARLGVWPGQVSPIAALPELSPRPVLLIFGEYEAEGAQAEAQFAAAQEPKDMWIVPGAGHGRYSITDPAGYEQRILEFLKTHRGTQP